MENYCYLCGTSPANHNLELKDTFTNHNYAKYPQSKYLCDRCNWAIPLRCKYIKPDGKESTLYSRNWSWLISKEKSYPIIEDDTVRELPTRAMIREWIINPPNPPFTIAIAESGQKHILFMSQESCDRDLFPILFEHDVILIQRNSTINCLKNCLLYTSPSPRD